MFYATYIRKFEISNMKIEKRISHGVRSWYLLERGTSQSDIRRPKT